MSLKNDVHIPLIQKRFQADHQIPITIQILAMETQLIQVEKRKKKEKKCKNRGKNRVSNWIWRIMFLFHCLQPDHQISITIQTFIMKTWFIQVKRKNISIKKSWTEFEEWCSYFTNSETFPARPPNSNNNPNPGYGDPVGSGRKIERKKPQKIE